MPSNNSSSTSLLFGILLIFGCLVEFPASQTTTSTVPTSTGPTTTTTTTTARTRPPPPPSTLPSKEDVGYSWVGMQMLIQYYNKLSELFDVDQTKEAVILQNPGVVIAGLQFDLDYWRETRLYSPPSPMEAAFELTDDIPAVATTFVPKNRISDLWKWLLVSYQWADSFWENQMCQLLEHYPPVEGYMYYVRVLLDEYQKMIDENDAKWNNCARRRSFLQCVNEQKIHDEKALVRWKQYEQQWRLMTWSRARYNTLFARNGDSVMSNYSVEFRRASGQDVGSGSGTSTFHTISFSPEFWWLWFVDQTDPSFETLYRDPYSGQDYRTPPDSEFHKIVLSEDELYFSGGFYQPHPNWLALGGISLDSGALFEIADHGEQVNITLEVAKVEIQRPWYNQELFHLLRPLAERGFGIGGWSTGVLNVSNTGAFPLTTHAFLVARKICFSAFLWDINFVEDLLASSNQTNSVQNLLFGPFTVRGDTHFFDQTPTRAANLVGTDDGFCISTPQIVGWLAGVNPLSPSVLVDPNHDLFTCNRSAATPRWLPLPNVTDYVPPETPTTTPMPTPMPTPVPDLGTIGLQVFPLLSPASSVSPSSLLLLFLPLSFLLVALCSTL